MSYSCTALAGNVEKAWSNACYKQTGSSNRYIGTDGKSYFYEIGREREDGAIVGSVHQFNADMTGCHRVGSFKIKPNGDVEVKPKAMPKNFTPSLVQQAKMAWGVA
jgi:hypothetical protein